MKYFMSIILLLTGSLILPINAGATDCVNGMKQWTDEKGVMHWSGEACGDERKEQQVKQKKYPAKVSSNTKMADDRSSSANDDGEIKRFKAEGFTYHGDGLFSKDFKLHAGSSSIELVNMNSYQIAVSLTLLGKKETITCMEVINARKRGTVEFACPDSHQRTFLGKIQSYKIMSSATNMESVHNKTDKNSTVANDSANRQADSSQTSKSSNEEQQYDSDCQDKIIVKSYSLQGVGYVQASEAKRWTTGVIYNPERRPPQYRATYNVFGQYKGNLMKIGTAKCDIYNYGNGNVEVHTNP